MMLMKREAKKRKEKMLVQMLVFLVTLMSWSCRGSVEEGRVGGFGSSFTSIFTWLKEYQKSGTDGTFLAN
jgi:hypothetical protein